MNWPRPTPIRTALGPLNRWTLQFGDWDTEWHYRSSHRARNLMAARQGLSIAAVLNLLFFALDPLVFERNLAVIMACHGGLMTFWFAGMIWCTRQKYWQTRWPLLLMLTAFFITLNYGAYAWAGHPPAVYLASFMLVLLGGAVLLPLIFMYAFTTLSVSMLAYLLMLWLAGHVSVLEYLILLLEFVTAWLMGLIVLHRQESFHRRDFASAQVIDRERARHRDLLNSILPARVAERLENGETVADDFADATVLFADIVGFTGLASAGNTEDVVRMLNEAFGRFDALVEKHGLEKVKTIGDAYMVAGGLSNGCGRDHAVAMAELALDMLEAARQVRGPDGEAVELRIGIHTGAVMAGVIGRHRFLYDLWGDTVNVASRMETLGAPGRIHVSDEVRGRLGEAYEVEPRGEIEVKGKGRVATWFLDGRRAAAQAAE